MQKKIICILAAVLILAGCAGNKTQVKSDRNSIGTPNGMIEYLRSQRLPALISADPWPNEYAPGVKLTTAHYEIYTTLLEPLMLSQVPGFMESAHRGYQSQLPQPFETKNKFPIYLFAKRSQWEDFTKNFTGGQARLYLKIKRGAYYLNGSCVAYNIGRQRTFSVLGHEGWHQFNKMHFKYRLPSWLDEGIAMLFETSRYDKGLFTFEPGGNLQRLGGLKATFIKGQIIPLEKLIAMNPGEAIAAESDEKVVAFYSQSYALVRFLREEDYGKHLAKYHKLMNDGLQGRWPLGPTAQKIATDRNIPLTVQWNRAVGTGLFDHYIDKDIDKIEQEYLNYCRKIVYHIKLRAKR